ncbi:MAG: ABC transporter ATP-binding protein [Pedobacter sp.]|nr:MAG: ABC transporter ATP-binding protein [Pedobacter sp.]
MSAKHHQKIKKILNKLILNGIEKTYGSNTVLQFVQWEINTDVYWLKGGNGTGKTTLFRIISGQTPFNGSVILDGLNLKDKPTQFKEKISYAEAEPQYPAFVTGQELINFYKDVRKANQTEIDRLTDFFEMTSFLVQKVGGYSSGMLKKLSLICAFIGDADLYILDEPLITIDAASADKLYLLIREKSKLGKSFLISSHQEVDNTKLPLDCIFKIEDKQIVKC